jgi:hypothetical protein
VRRGKNHPKPSDQPLKVKRGSVSYYQAAFVAVVVSAIAVTGQSLWIDEGTSAVDAIQPALHQWWQAFRADGSSNLQLPLHYFYLWLWEKIFGGSEIALRAANVPPLALAFVAIVWGLEARPRWQFWFIVLASINAFTWYYANEARPYILMFAGCCFTFACLARAYFSPISTLESRSWFFILLASSLMVCATSLIAVPWAMASILGIALLLGKKALIQLIQKHLFWSFVWVFTLCCLGAYYLWTLRLGAIPTYGRTGISNLAFIAYEQLGFAGLGPGRLELRQGDVKSLLKYVPLLGAAALAFLAIAWETARFLATRWNKKSLSPKIAVLILLPSACALLAAWIGHARLWGRHFTPLFPFVLLGLTIGIEQLLEKKTTGAKIAVSVFLIVLILSSLEIRFAPRHTKDDYRHAAAYALPMIRDNKLVWWAANKTTGFYYRLPRANERGATYWESFESPFPSDLASRSEPQMIVLSKPDIYDAHGAITAVLKEKKFTQRVTLQGFTIWEKP